MMNKPGIYFGMPDEEYHAIPRLSASGIKKLLVSPMVFWSESWMNPNRKPVDSQAMIIGKAYHKRILEGKRAFDAFYAPYFEQNKDAVYVDTIETCKEILEKHGVSTLSKWKKADYVSAVEELNAGYLFLDAERKVYQNQHEGKIFLSKGLIEEIEIAAAMIEKHEQLSKCIQGGYPEVTILWDCEETGVKMKARIDYLKTRAITDLKTFANKSNKTIDRALYSIMAGEKYHVQSAVYYEAVEYARKLAKQGNVFMVPYEHGDNFLVEGWIDAFIKTEETNFVFIFQQKGIAPVTRGRIMPKTQVNEIGTRMMREAQKSFSMNLDHFGSDPWLDIQPIEEFNDHEFPVWINEL